MVGLGSAGGSAERWRTVAGAVVLGALIAVLFDSAYERLFSAINTVDDEGYAIVTLASFADGNALYDEVFSQYGPGYYTIVGGAMKLLGVAFTSEGARWVNLFMWLASTGLAGVALLRLTRSVVIAGVGALIAFSVLSVDAFEPLHPGATIGFGLLVLVAALALLTPSRIPAAMACVGAVCVALAAVKINVGGLAGISILFACALASPWLRPVTAVRWAAIGLFVAVPFALMRSNLDDGNIQRWAAITAAGAVALALVALWQGAGSRPTRRDLGWLVGGGLAVLALVTVVPVILGTSVGGLIDGWLIRPAEHPGVTFFPLWVDSRGPLWALLGLVGASAATVALTGRPADSWRWGAFGATQLAAGLLIWASFASPLVGLPTELTRATVIAAPLAWMVAVSPPGESRDLRFIRIAIPALALLQTLHAYPIPGAQLGWSEVLFVIVGGVCVRDGIANLAPAARERFGEPARWLPAAASALVLVGGAWFALDRVKPFTDSADAAYAGSVPLGLDGTDGMRTDTLRAAQLQALSRGIEANCDSLLTLPGMNSLSLYSGVPAPDELASPWMLFENDEEQARAVALAESEPRLCAVTKPDLLKFWKGFSDDGIPEDRPLYRYIEDEFKPVRDYEGYELQVRAGG